MHFFLKNLNQFSVTFSILSGVKEVHLSNFQFHLTFYLILLQKYFGDHPISDEILDISACVLLGSP